MVVHEFLVLLKDYQGRRNPQQTHSAGKFELVKERLDFGERYIFAAVHHRFVNREALAPKDIPHNLLHTLHPTALFNKIDEIVLKGLMGWGAKHCPLFAARAMAWSTLFDKEGVAIAASNEARAILLRKHLHHFLPPVKEEVFDMDDSVEVVKNSHWIVVREDEASPALWLRANPHPPIQVRMQ